MKYTDKCMSKDAGHTPWIVSCFSGFKNKASTDFEIAPFRTQYKYQNDKALYDPIKMRRNRTWMKHDIPNSIIALLSFVIFAAIGLISSSSVSATSASITTDNSITLDVSPSGTGTSIKAASINIQTTCRAGYNLAVATPSGSDLYAGGDNSQSASFTAVDGISALSSDNNTNKWGYTLTPNASPATVFSPLSANASILKTSSQTASPDSDINDTFPIYYGVKVDDAISPGSYQMSNNSTIVYQLTTDAACMVYTVLFNANGGTGTMADQDMVVNEAVKLSANTFTAPTSSSYTDADNHTITGTSGKLWTFWGWNTKADGTGDWYKDREEVSYITGSGDTVTLYAQWKQATLADMAVATTGTKTIINNTMQDMDPAICYNSTAHSAKNNSPANSPYDASTNPNGYHTVTLLDYRGKDTRGESPESPESYTVAKLADNNCWMISDLHLGSTEREVTLTSEDTDTVNDFTLPIVETSSTKTQWGTNNSTDGLDVAHVYQFNDTKNLYNWYTATAGTSYTNLTSTTSICPSNWKLLTQAQGIDYLSAIDESPNSTNTSVIIDSPPNFTNGYYNSTTQTAYTNKVYWTADGWRNSSTGYYYGYFFGIGITSGVSYIRTTYGYQKMMGLGMRCLASRGMATITYNSNNTAGSISTQTVEISSGSLASSNLFTAETNRQFKEWNTAADGSGTSYSAGSNASALNLYPGQDLILYAIWDETYYIAFNANESSVGGAPGSATGTMSKQTVVKDTAIAIKTSTFALTGYIFLGWNTATDGTGTFYNDGQKITNLTSTGNTITLYAVWVNGALLDTGQNVNQKLKRLAGNSSATYSTEDTAITAIVRSNALPSSFTASTDNTISDSTSPNPIYAWYDSTNTTIYYYSDVATILMNKTSSYFFYQMRALSDLNTISTWNTVKVTTMRHMLNNVGRNATTWSIGDLSSWDTSSVTDMCGMFNNAGRDATTWSIGDLSSWDTSSVTDMSYMFALSGRNTATWSIGDLSSWNTSSVTNMSYMFNSAGYNATTWSIGNLSSWDTSNVTDMNHMFGLSGRNATTWFIGDLSSWDTSNVTDMSYMFNADGYNATTWSIGNLSSWDTSNVTDMNHMFGLSGRNATTWFIGDLSSWDTSNVTDMSQMFGEAGYNATTWSVGDLSSWDTSNVTDMNRMFGLSGRNATTWSVGDLSSWDTSNVTDMSYMFNADGYNATTWSVGDLSSWDTSNVTDMNHMFALSGDNATAWSVGDLSSWDTSNVTDMSYMFNAAGENATTWSVGDLSSWDTSNVTNMSTIFNAAGENATTWSIGDLSSWNTSSVTDMSYMFALSGRDATTWSIGDLSSWNTSSVTNMSYMFNAAGDNATTWSIGDLSSWDTSSVTDMNHMFALSGRNATTWSISGLSSWDTSSVTNMDSMFYHAGYSATTWSITIPKTNNGTATGAISNTTSNLYGSSTSVTATPDSGRAFTLAN